MLQVSKILMVRTDDGEPRSQRLTVAMTVFIAAVVLIITGCQRKPVMAHAHFVHVPATGWQQTLPLTFYPEYDDSTVTYNLLLAVRHQNNYAYSNLSLVVDVISEDSTVNRRPMNLTLADEYGNWTDGGFGTLYQERYILATKVKPADARSVVVWQAMQACDTLTGLVDVGITTIPQ